MTYVVALSHLKGVGHLFLLQKLVTQFSYNLHEVPEHVKRLVPAEMC